MLRLRRKCTDPGKGSQKMSDATKLIAAHVMDRRLLLDDILKNIERIVDCPINFGDLLDLGHLSWPLIRDRQSIEEFANRNGELQAVCNLIRDHLGWPHVDLHGKPLAPAESTEV
jgi:hypothetical protein